MRGGVLSHGLRDAHSGADPRVDTRRARNDGFYEWCLPAVTRLKAPRKPKAKLQPAWFKPF